MSARHNSSTEVVLWYDDTEALGIPKFTRRPPKNLTTSRFLVVPCIMSDLARQKDFYVYTAKGRYKKNSNRVCTQLYFTFRAAKRTTLISRFARSATLIADNALDNKNNTILAFCTELVLRRWLDVIELIYGPPGHTHGGGDAQHEIHNEICGNFTSPTLVHFLARYSQSWHQDHTRPTPCILDVQYDWHKYYKPYLQAIGGHTNTQRSLYGACLSNLARPKRHCYCQVEAQGRERRVARADNQVGKPGWELLRGLPKGFPEVIPPQENVMEKKYYKQLLGARMRECLEAEQAPGALNWLKKAALHGAIPGQALASARIHNTWCPGFRGAVAVR